MRITIDVPTPLLMGALHCATGSGTAYWCDLIEPNKQQAPPSYLDPRDHGYPATWGALTPAGVTYRDRETGERYNVNADGIARAFGLMALHYPRLFGYLMEESPDGEVGDALIQLAAFGELRYA